VIVIYVKRLQEFFNDTVGCCKAEGEFRLRLV